MRIHSGFSVPDTVAAESYWSGPQGLEEGVGGPVVNTLNKELASNPYRHRTSALRKGASVVTAVGRLVRSSVGSLVSPESRKRSRAEARPSAGGDGGGGNGGGVPVAAAAYEATENPVFNSPRSHSSNEEAHALPSPPGQEA